MSLRTIVAALGGDLYQGGARANVPAPGHDAADRSVSLLLSEGRVVVHSFGAATWQAVRDDLHRRNLIGADGRVAAGAARGRSDDGERPAILRSGAKRRQWLGSDRGEDVERSTLVSSPPLRTI